MSLSEVKKRCVTDFVQAENRSSIMAGLEAAVKKLIDVGIQGELWVDGSFLTEKIDPKDVDLLLRINAEFADNATKEQEETLEWFEKGLSDFYRCDSYVWREYSPGHTLHVLSEAERIYWTGWFGRSRSGHPKGIAVVAIPKGAL